MELDIKGCAQGLHLSGEDAEALREVEQLSSRTRSGKLDQVAGDCAGYSVRADLLECQALGLFEAAQRLTDLPSHDMRLGKVQVIPGLPLGR